MKLSYGITVHNEHEELNQLLELLTTHIDQEDEIIIVDDFSNQETQNIIKKYNVKHYQRKLDGDFATHKNFVIEKCTGDYIFAIDADEYPNITLLQQLKDVLRMNPIDLLYVPRVNTVDGITEQHIKQWGWRVNAPYEIYNEKVMDTESEEYKFLKKNGLIVEENTID